MKKIFYILYLWGGIVLAQDCKKELQIQLVDKIKYYKSTDLLPYYDKKSDKWGFFDKNSRKKITESIFNNAKFFQPNLVLYFDFYNGDSYCEAKILGSNYKIKNVEKQYPKMEMPTSQEVFSNKIINPNILGFEVDENGELKGVAPQYSSKFGGKYGSVNIEDIFNYKGKYYAKTFISNENEKYCQIIDQQGNLIKKLDMFADIKSVYSTDNDVWFFTGNGKKYRLESIFTHKKIENITDRIISYDKNLGYAILKMTNGIGVIDLTTMEWKVFPDTKNDFSKIGFTSMDKLEITNEKIIPIELVNKNREKANIYIINQNYTLQSLDGKIYKVK